MISFAFRFSVLKVIKELRNILNAWNLFNAACIAYETSATNKSDYIVNYIKGLLEFNCPDEEDEYNTPVLKNFALSVIYSADEPMIDIDKATLSYEHENNLIDNSLKLINNNTNEVIASNLPISRIINLNITDYRGNAGETIGFVLEATDVKGATIRSNVFNVTIPNIEPEEDVVLEIKSLNVVIGSSQCEIFGLVATCSNPDKFNSNGLFAYIKEGNGVYQLIQSNITPENSMNIEFEEIWGYELGPDGLELTVKLSGTGKDNINYYTTFLEVIPGSSEEPDNPDDPDGPQPYPDDPDEPDPDNPEPDDPDSPIEPDPTEPDEPEPDDPIEPEPDNPDEPVEDDTAIDNNEEEDLGNGG